MDIKWEALVGSACDFKGKDMEKALTSQDRDPPGECRKKCQLTDDCTHYVWTDQECGTYYPKKEGAKRADAFLTTNNKWVCGIPSSKCSGQV